MGTTVTTTTQDESRLRRWYGVFCDRGTYFMIAVAVAFLVWWIVAEAATPDGVDVRWNWNIWQWIGFSIGLVGPAVLSALAAPKFRRWWVGHVKPDGENVSLKWLVGIGLAVTLVLAAVLFYGQAELLTDPGESAWSIESPELLDIARSTAFGLGAIGAIAALLVGYRRQKSTEDAHDHQVQTTKDNLELEHKKQKVEEISNLHDRYAKAVEQLASENPTIRLGGVYVLSALANDWLATKDYRQRQVCVDMLCAYLRSDPEVPADVSDDKQDEYLLNTLKKDQDVRKAALESLSEIRTLERLNEPSAPTSGLPQSIQDLYRTLKATEVIPRVRIDLAGITLRGLNLRHARLAYLPLNNANLAGANLSRSELTRTDFGGATMNGVDLSHATLLRTNLTGARLECVDLAGSVLVDPRLRGATITGPEGHAGGSLALSFFIGVNPSTTRQFSARGFRVLMDGETRRHAWPYMHKIGSLDKPEFRSAEGDLGFRRLERFFRSRKLELPDDLWTIARFQIDYPQSSGEKPTVEASS